MPIVKVGNERIKFPDTMSSDEIKAALDARFQQAAMPIDAPQETRSYTGGGRSAAAGRNVNGVTLEDIDNALLEIPGVSTFTELAAGFNRTLAAGLDMFGPDRINNVLEVLGSSERVPTVSEQVPMKGEFDSSLAGRVAGSAGEVGALALGAGQGLKFLAGRMAPATAGESAATGVLRQMGTSTAGQDLVSGVASGVGEEIGREVGGETGAMIGAVTAPLAPALAGDVVKRAFAGGHAGQKNIQQALNDFAEIDSVPTVGQATESPLRQGLENMMSRVLGGQPIRRSIERTESAVQKRLSDIAGRISKIKGDYEAGLVINRGIKGEGGFVDRFTNKSSVLWRGFDDLIDDQSSVAASKTTQVLDELVNDTAFGKLLNNPIVAGIKQGLDESGGVIDYRTFRQLRSSIGERLGGNDLVSDIPRAQLKKLYGSMTDDLKQVAKDSGPQAERLFSRASKYTAAGHKRLDEFVDRITNKVDFDKVFNAVTRGGEGIQSVRAIKRSLKPEEWEAVASNVVRKMGRATSGQQDDVGEIFSLNKFLTDWDKLGRVKGELFSGSKTLDQYRSNLDRVAKVASRFKEAAKEMSNPSGTGQFSANVGLVGGGAGALVSGNLPAFGAIVGAVASNAAASRLMSSPRFVKWLASSSNVKTLSGPIAGLVDVAKDTGEYEAVSELISTLKAGSQEQEMQDK